MHRMEFVKMKERNGMSAEEVSALGVKAYKESMIKKRKNVQKDN